MVGLFVETSSASIGSNRCEGCTVLGLATSWGLRLKLTQKVRE